MPVIRSTVPTGALTDQGRTTVQRDLATVLPRWEGAPDTGFLRWSAGGSVVRYADLVALAKGERADA
ncbi:hypothetical protein ACWCXE_27715 [Streptomyces sp. NPDC001780]